MQIGTLTTGAGVTTTFNPQFLPEFLLIGAVEDDNVLQGISITIAGKERINIQSQALISGFMKKNNAGLLGTDVKVGLVIPIAIGGNGQENISIKLTNAGATTPDVYAFSTRKNQGVVISAYTQTVQSSSNQVFQDFQGLFFDDTNVQQLDVLFGKPGQKDMWSEKLDPKELLAIMAKLGGTRDASGKLGTVNFVDNSLNFIRSVRIYTTSGGTVTVLQTGYQAK
ncbi:MAG: hypothetical protein WCD31_08800 [Gillisia sp.]